MMTGRVRAFLMFNVCATSLSAPALPSSRGLPRISHMHDVFSLPARFLVIYFVGVTQSGSRDRCLLRLHRRFCKGLRFAVY